MKRKASVEETSAQSMVVAVDRIFASSAKLNGVFFPFTFLLPLFFFVFLTYSLSL
jgi:hypothetical protein